MKILISLAGHRIGHDLNFLASSGILGLVDKPSPLPIPVADICGGSFPAAVQILAALHLRNKTGEGCYIDVAMADNTMAMAVMTHTVNSYAGAQVSKGNDFLDGSVPCYYVYPTADGYVAVGALEPKYWKQLLHLLDAPELVDYQYAKGKRGEYALTKLTQIFKSKTNQEWGKLLEKHDVLADIVTDIENLPQSHPHFAAKKLTSDLNIGEEKLFTVLRPPLNLSNGETATESTPRLGEQNAEILSKL